MLRCSQLLSKYDNLFVGELTLYIIRIPSIRRSLEIEAGGYTYLRIWNKFCSEKIPRFFKIFSRGRYFYLDCREKELWCLRKFRFKTHLRPRSTLPIETTYASFKGLIQESYDIFLKRFDCQLQFGTYFVDPYRRPFSRFQE